MKGWLIYRKQEAERNKFAVTMYHKACARRKIHIQLKYLEELSPETAGSVSAFNNKKTSLPDFVIMRADAPFFSATLEKSGCRVFNSAQVSALANDKLKTIQMAKSLGIATPITCVATKTDAVAVGARLGYPLVMKPRDGHGGQDVLWIDSEAMLVKILPTFHHESFLLQKPVSSLGQDLRVYVIGGQVVVAMLRSRDDDFRSNYCLGGHASIHSLTPEEQTIVGKITEALPMDFAGIDLLYHEGQPVLSEIEDVVGARMVYHLTNLDIIDMYVEHIATQLGL
ncbi:MAG: ATP-grasp domain-containing protein [Ruminococcaceae bacterium]|nr:ATP-grasp domain-containing protein [Oscillospiraceae bacterium]